jgi:hypothetical protein
MRCDWDEIHGFVSPREYRCFVDFIEAQVSNGFAEELPADPTYSAGEIYGGRWFKDRASGRIWRLVAPDFPFKGLWEPVSKEQSDDGKSHQANSVL